MKTVSVIIPIYNMVNYLRECIDSIVGQTLSDIEIILVNDGSTDGSESIAREYAARYPNIRLLEQENAGLSAARNRGLQVAVGKYVYFIDSDDWLDLTALERLYQISEQEQLDMLGFGAQTFYDTEQLKKAYASFGDSYCIHGNYPKVVSGPELLALLQKNRDYIMSSCLRLIRRQFLTENEIWFYEGILHEDNLFFFQILMKAKRTRCIKESYYYRRIRSSSIMTEKETAENLRGYYVCLQRILWEAAQESHSKEQQEAIVQVVRSMSYHVKRLYYSLNAEERNKFLDDLTDGGFYLFEGTLRMYLDEMQRLISKHKRLQRLRTKAELAVSYINQIPLVWVLRNRGIDYLSYRYRLKLTPNKICVSVIIPVYNSEKYLNECLESIQKQNLKQIEIICIDDGSTDGSGQILEERRRMDPRITVLHQKNKGAGAARNKGIACAKGEYLLFLDADDIFSADLCNTAYYQSHKYKAEVCLFGAQRYDMQTKRTEKMGWVLHEHEIPKGVFSASDVKDRIFQITTGCPWSKLFLRKFVIRNKLRFQNLRNTNDVFFVRMACALASRITSVKGRSLVTYRYHAGTNLQSQKNKAPLEFYKAFVALKKELLERELYDMLEKSYVNMVLDESLFNLETAGTASAQNKVRKLLQTEGFAFFGFDLYEKEYFYRTDRYAEYIRLRDV